MTDDFKKFIKGILTVSQYILFIVAIILLFILRVALPAIIAGFLFIPSLGLSTVLFKKYYDGLTKNMKRI